MNYFSFIIKLTSLILISNLIISCGSSENRAPRSYTFSGTVSGLDGSLEISNQKNRVIINKDGQYSFSDLYSKGDNYSIKITNYPNKLFCTLVNANGQLAESNIDNININCYDKVAFKLTTN